MFHKTRICESCKKTIYYKHRNSYYAAKKANSLCRKCAYLRESERCKITGGTFKGKHHTEETKEILRQKNLNAKHFYTKEFSDSVKKGMNGNTGGGDNYPIWVSKYGIEEAKKRLLESSKKKGHSGKKNPMWGKPAPQGSGLGWKGWYNGFFFRSIRELVFLIELETQKRIFVSAETSFFSIVYIDYDGSEKTYRPDFFVDNKYLYEIKPKRLWNTPKCVAKKNAALEYCKKQGFEYVLYDPIIDFDSVSEKDRTGQIKWVGEYGDKFRNFKPSRKISEVKSSTRIGGFS